MLSNNQIRKIIKIRGPAELDFERRRAACDGKYGLCQYHKICEVPDDSKFKGAVMDSYSIKDEKWRAWT